MVAYRHLQKISHRQTLLQYWSLTDIVTEMITMLQNRSHTDTATGSLTYRHCHTLSPLQTIAAPTRTDTATDLDSDKQWHKIILLQTLPRNWLVTNFGTQIFANKHGQSIRHLETLERNWSPTARATELTTDRRSHWLCTGNKHSRQT
jgi:hypothetical protein